MLLLSQLCVLGGGSQKKLIHCCVEATAWLVGAFTLLIAPSLSLALAREVEEQPDGRAASALQFSQEMKVS